jgi:hypothetical protein
MSSRAAMFGESTSVDFHDSSSSSGSSASLSSCASCLASGEAA